MPDKTHVIKTVTVVLWLVGGWLFGQDMADETVYASIATGLVNALALLGTYLAGKEGREASK